MKSFKRRVLYTLYAHILLYLRLSRLKTYLGSFILAVIQISTINVPDRFRNNPGIPTGTRELATRAHVAAALPNTHTLFGEAVPLPTPRSPILVFLSCAHIRRPTTTLGHASL